MKSDELVFNMGLAEKWVVQVKKKCRRAKLAKIMMSLVFSSCLLIVVSASPTLCIYIDLQSHVFMWTESPSLGTKGISS